MQGGLRAKVGLIAENFKKHHFMKTVVQLFPLKVKPPQHLYLLLHTNSSNNSRKASVPEVRDGDDNQQVERHSEQSEAVQQCFDERGFGRNRR